MVMEIIRLESLDGLLPCKQCSTGDMVDSSTHCGVCTKGLKLPAFVKHECIGMEGHEYRTKPIMCMTRNAQFLDTLDNRQRYSSPRGLEKDSQAPDEMSEFKVSDDKSGYDCLTTTLERS